MLNACSTLKYIRDDHIAKMIHRYREKFVSCKNMCAFFAYFKYRYFSPFFLVYIYLTALRPQRILYAMMTNKIQKLLRVCAQFKMWKKFVNFFLTLFVFIPLSDISRSWIGKGNHGLAGILHPSQTRLQMVWWAEKIKGKHRTNVKETKKNPLIWLLNDTSPMKIASNCIPSCGIFWQYTHLNAVK